MLSGYGVDIDAVIRSYSESKKNIDSYFDTVMNATSSHTWSDEYESYGVDNDFDLAEAIYEECARSTGNLVRNPDFVEFRINIAMDPEYTERCLSSVAFRDVKDEILRRLSCNE